MPYLAGGDNTAVGTFCATLSFARAWKVEVIKQQAGESENVSGKDLPLTAW